MITGTTQGRKQKLGRKVVLTAWLISATFAYLTGHIFASNISYITYSTTLPAEVIKKSSYKVRSNTNSNSSSTIHNIIYQFNNPDVKGKVERKIERAPLVYGQMRIGDAIEVYYNPAMSPTSRIAHPVQVWFSTILCLVGLFFSLLVTLVLNKHSVLNEQASKKYIGWLLGILALPIIVNFILVQQHNKQREHEIAAEQRWPNWPALEQAVPKPSWWNEVAIKYFDPMNYTSEEYQYYLEHNKGPDRHLRSFKVAYVFMLLHQDDPLQQGWDLAKGTTRAFMPLYEFFLSQYMNQQWDGNCYNYACNDATQMVEMAGNLLSMKLDENQLDSSLKLAESIMQHKYSRGNNQGKFYFLYSYRRLLEHLHNQQYARKKLDDLVSENITEAEGLNNPSLLRRWKNFWTSGEREVGMYSH